MSHFVALVLTKTGTEEEVSELLAPYDENTRVEEYEKKCWCVGGDARNEASDMADAVCGDYNTLRNTFNENEIVQELRSRSVSLYDVAYGGPEVSPEDRKAARKEVSRNEWEENARKLMQGNGDCIAVVVDLHI